MAGYFRKLNGYVYEGTYPSDAPLQNGDFVEIVEGVVKKLSNPMDALFRVVEKTTLYGRKALVLRVLKVPEQQDFYMVENELPNHHGEDWDEAEYELPAGELVRMKRPLLGEELIRTATDYEYGEAKVNGVGYPADNGDGLWFW